MTSIQNRRIGEQMSDYRLSEFRKMLNESDVALFVGTGVTAACAGDSTTATWGGLIESAIERASCLSSEPALEWVSLCRNMLDLGMKEGDPKILLNAADLAVDKIKRAGQQEYKKWVEDAIGSIEPRSDTLIREIINFRFPIVTTNYDSLLESVGGIAGVTWKQETEFMDVLVRKSRAIAHLHGSWTDPESMVFTEGDYNRLLAHEKSMQLEKALSTLRHIVFIGYGAGLSDPNFSALMKWHSRLFGNSAIVHYRLCLENEVDGLRRLHANDSIVPIPYGSSFDDLPKFLRTCRPEQNVLAVNEAGLARNSTQLMQQEIRSEVLDESVVLGSRADRNDSPFELIPPHILPTSYTDYAHSYRDSKQLGKLKRLDPEEVFQSSDCVIVVGGEGSGLTTTLRWFLLETSKFLGSAVPIFLRFSDLRGGRKPVKRALDRASILKGLASKRGEDLPDCVLAIDDFEPSAPIARKVVSELADLGLVSCFVGCAEGDEDQLFAEMSDAGLHPRTVYLGNLSDSEIERIASGLGFDGRGELVKRVTRVLDSEGLQRTPLTVCLLLQLLANDRIRRFPSQTSIVEAYVILLLKVTEANSVIPDLPERDLLAILSTLAECMTRGETYKMTEATAVQAVEEMIQRFAWPGSPTDIIRYFVEKRILLKVDGTISFARSAFFFLMAARQACTDTGFRSLVLGDPFYYAPVVSRYAALAPSNIEILSSLDPVVVRERDERFSAASPYDQVEPVLASAGDMCAPAEQDDMDSEPGPGGDLEHPGVSNRVTFGLKVEEMTKVERLRRAARLVSMVVRDLGQIDDLGRKQEALVDCLEMWGKFISALSVDESVQALRNELSLELRRTAKSGDDLKPIDEFVLKAVPASIGLGEIDRALASPALIVLFEQVWNSRLVFRSNECIAASLLFLILTHPRGWAKRVLECLEGLPTTWIVREFFLALCEDKFVVDGDFDQDCLTLCLELRVSSRRFESKSQSSAFRSAYLQRLKRKRVSHEMRTRR